MSRCCGRLPSSEEVLLGHKGRALSLHRWGARVQHCWVNAVFGGDEQHEQAGEAAGS